MNILKGLWVRVRALIFREKVEQELDEARWFTAREIRGFGEWGDEEAALRLPRKDSIARTLIETWVASVET